MEDFRLEVSLFFSKILGSTDKKLYYRIGHQDLEFNDGVSLEVKLLISQMLCKDPELRPDIDKVIF